MVAADHDVRLGHVGQDAAGGFPHPLAPQRLIGKRRKFARADLRQIPIGLPRPLIDLRQHRLSVGIIAEQGRNNHRGVVFVDEALGALAVGEVAMAGEFVGEAA